MKKKEIEVKDKKIKKEKPNILSPIEKETIICFNEAERTANVFTYNKKWQKHFENKLNIKAEYENGFGGKEYSIEKERIKLPRVPANMSTTEKKNIAERLSKGRQLKSG